MTDAPFNIHVLARQLSLEPTDTDAGLQLSRHGWSVEVPADLSAHLRPHTPRARHHCFGVFFGVRLAIDRVAANFDVDNERPGRPDEVYAPRQVPSVYGERLPRLVPTTTVAWFRALTGQHALARPWLIDGLQVVYLLETGKHLHPLTVADVDAMELSRDKLVDDARHALFYDAYKLKPRRIAATEHGLLRVFRSPEGLGATRALLMPDFDYDAAREHGCFSLPSRDTLVIGRPDDRSTAAAMFARVARETNDLVASATFPLSSVVCTMEPDRVYAQHYATSPPLPPASLATRHGLAAPDLGDRLELVGPHSLDIPSPTGNHDSSRHD